MVSTGEAKLFQTALMALKLLCRENLVISLLIQPKAVSCEKYFTVPWINHFKTVLVLSVDHCNRNIQALLRTESIVIIEMVLVNSLQDVHTFLTLENIHFISGIDNQG